MGRRVMAVLAAVLVGLVGVVSVLFYANGADARAVAAQRPQTVLITTALVPSGTSAADAMAKGLIAPSQVAAKGVPIGALSNVDAATGKLVALTDIAPGEFVVAGRFGTASLSPGGIQVPDGQFAISLTLSDAARVGAFMTPGSHIVIYDTYSPVAAAAKAGTAGAAAGGKQTRVLLDDVLVIAMGSTTLTPPTAAAGGDQAQAAATGALVTIALTPDNAAKVVHVIQTGGSMYAGLRGADAKANLGEIVSDATIFTK
jgi:pilus assembly protein CpaB